MRVDLARTAAACLLCLLSGPNCDKSTGADYWPMANGNRWVFRYVEIITYPGSLPDTAVSPYSMSWECVGLATLGNGARAWALCSGPAFSDTAYYREVGNAVLVYDDVSQAEPDTFLSLPLEEGKAWTYGGQAMLVTKKGTVVVPAGTYSDCWQIQIGSDELYQSCVWLAPNVGMVLLQDSSSSGGYTDVMRRELTQAVLK